MTIYDAIIIYLAIGAPFAVYRLMRERKSPAVEKWLSAFTTFLFWIPLAAEILRREFQNRGYVTVFAKRDETDSLRDKKIGAIGDDIKDVLTANGSTLSVFNYRDVFDRYAGLTLLVGKKNESGFAEDTKLFEIAGRENPKLAAKCLNRRNAIRLKRHHTEARRDFLMMLEMALAENANAGHAAGIALELAEILRDEPAILYLRKMAARSGFEVNKDRSESVLWNSGKQKSQSKTVAPLVSNLAAAATSPKND